MHKLGTMLLVAAWAVPGFGTETVESIEKRSAEQWAGIKSLTAETSLQGSRTYPTMRTQNANTGVYQHLKKGNKELFRQDIKSRQGTLLEGKTEENVVEESMIMVADGEVIRMYTESATQRLATKRTQAGSGIAIGGRELFDFMRKGASLRVLPDAKIDGQDAYAIEAAIDGGKFKTLYYISKDRGIMLQRVAITIKEDEETPSTVYTIKNIKTGVEIDPSIFVFEFPPGVEVKDQTVEAPPPPKKP